MNGAVHRRQRSRSLGYTLVEMMIAMCIVAILASVALPQYRVYTIRARVSECLALVGPAKVAVMEFFVTRGRFPADNAEAGYSQPATANCGAVDIDDNTIILRLAIPGVAGSDIVFAANPVTGGEWDCGVPNHALWVYVPASCRNPLI